MTCITVLFEIFLAICPMWSYVASKAVRSCPTTELQDRFPDHKDTLRQTAVSLMNTYPDVFFLSTGGLEMHPEYRPLVRVIASFVDRFTTKEAAHAAAI